MNNTPETDQNAVPHIGFYSCATVTAEFARKLERERDEAREELHDIRLNLGADAEGYTLLHAVCVLQQERDDERAGREAYKQLAVKHALEREQARKEAHRFRALHYSHLGINASASWFPWESKLGHE
jgi:hypothetical protein